MKKISNKTQVLLILGIIILLLVSGCSITAERHFERQMSPYSICWQDDEHFLVYCSIEQYYFTPNFLGNDDIHYDWAGGEIWRVNALSGNTELLIRDQSGLMYTYPVNDGRLSVRNDDIYYSDRLYTCKILQGYSGVEKIGEFTLPVISPDGNTLIITILGYEDTIAQYEIATGEISILYTTDDNVFWLDYSRNLLLINNIKLVDLTTGETNILLNGNTFDNYRIQSDALYGDIGNEWISLDISLWDTLTHENVKSKIFIDLDSLSHIEYVAGIHGVSSPNGAYYAQDGAVIDTLGNVISEYGFSSNEL